MSNCPLLSRKQQLDFELQEAQERMSVIQQEIEKVEKELEKKDYEEELRSAAYYANFGQCVPVLVSSHFDQAYIEEVVETYNVKYAMIDVHITCNGSHAVDCDYHTRHETLKIAWETLHIKNIDLAEHLASRTTNDAIESFFRKNLEKIDEKSAIDNWIYKASGIASGTWYGKESIVVFYQ